MNCLSAREALDRCLPDEAALYDALGNVLPAAAFDEVTQHVKNCPACQAALRRREKFDERAGQLTRDVPVPAGLRERLLARLEREAGQSEVPGSGSQTAVAQPVPHTVGKSQRSRRRMIISVAAAGILAAVGVGVWKFAVSGPAAMSMDEIAGYALSGDLKPRDLPELTQFRGGVDIQVPKTMQKLSYAIPFRRLNDPQLADREIAVYFFTWAEKGRKIPGRLVVIPLSLVKEPPAATSFLGGPIQYSKGFCATTWVEGQFVYVACMQQAGGGDLEFLRPKAQSAA